ncbi:hypothetical protein D3C80_1478900 [compost metagenome]
MASLVRQAVIELDDQAVDVVGQALLQHHPAAHLAPGLIACQVDLDADIAPGHALASEDVAGIELVRGEDVGGLGQLPDPPRHQPALATGAAADPAAVRKVDVLA